MIFKLLINLFPTRVAFLIFLTIVSFATFSQNKIALVIGNSSYQNAELRNPINDATDFAVKLITLDFTVTLKKDLNQDQFEEAVRDFTASIESRDVVLFYYSGHGMQAYGKNYLIPIGERIEAEDEIKHKSFNLDFFLGKLSDSESATNIIILDACRDNPFSGFRSSSRGFIGITAPSGTIISYSTGPGRVAYDGDGRNSPYTESLLECIDSPNQQIEAFFKEVRRKVKEKTQEKQTPWENSSLIDDFFFNPVQDQTDRSDPSQYVPVIASNTIIPVEKKAHEKPKTDYDFSGKEGTFTDSRDRQQYKWVRIGEQIWMGENLQYETKNSVCYENNVWWCRQYGYLYDWYEAQTVCPRGWHLPDDDEWIILEIFVDSKSKSRKPWSKKLSQKIDPLTNNYRGHDAGSNLKSGKFWHKKKMGSNKFHFSALPTGYRSDKGKYKNLHKAGYFWTGTMFKKDKSCYREINELFKGVGRFVGENNMFMSIRCVKDKD